MISKYFAKLVMLAEMRCAHEFEFVRNIHGDEIIRRNYKRSLWSCKKCGRDEFRDELFNPPPNDHLTTEGRNYVHKSN